MLKIRYGRIKGHAFLFQYETTTELKALITKFQNEIDLVFNEVFFDGLNNGQEELGVEFSKVLFDNLWDLYIDV